jgi:HEXXH motif-containing protein
VYPLSLMADLPNAFLSLPRSGESTTRTLRRKVRLVALKELLTHSAAGLGPRADQSMRTIQDVLSRVVRQSPGALLEAIGHPDVQVPLLVMSAGLRSPEEVLPSTVPALFAGLQASDCILDEPLLWEHPVHQIAFPGEGVVRFDPCAKALLVDASGLAVELEDGKRVDLPGLEAASRAGIEVVSRVTQLGDPALKLELCMGDSNPLAMDEAHPDKEGNSISLGGRSTDEWVASIQEALSIVKAGLPDWYEELRHTTQRILPVGFEPEKHLSASYREAPGIVYMTLHPDPLTMAEALIHETQHGKLNLLSWLDPVLRNAYSSWSESPVRPDLRPVMGVLLAVHAFVPVAAMHGALADQGHPVSKTPQFIDRQVQVLAGNAGGLATVEANGQPTELGKRVLQGLREVHDHLLGSLDPAVLPKDAMPPG